MAVKRRPVLPPDPLAGLSSFERQIVETTFQGDVNAYRQWQAQNATKGDPSSPALPVQPTPEPAAQPAPTALPMPGLPAPTPLTAEQRNAQAVLNRVLNEADLSSLAPWALQQLQQGRSIEEIDLDLPNQPAFQQRFAAIGLLQQRQKAGEPVHVPTPAEYMQLEGQYRDILTRAGMPKDFYDNRDDFTNFIAGQRSPAEIARIIQDGYQKVAQAPAEVRQYFGDKFGASGDSALAAWFLDPQRAEPALLKAAQEAQIGGTGRRFGFDVAEQTAGRLADVGVTGQQAQAGFEQLGQMKPIFEETIGETNDLSAEKTGVEAVFGLTGDAASEIERRRRERGAQFAGSGGFATSTAGIRGTGSSQR